MVPHVDIERVADLANADVHIVQTVALHVSPPKWVAREVYQLLHRVATHLKNEPDGRAVERSPTLCAVEFNLKYGVQGWCSPGWDKMLRFAVKTPVTAIYLPDRVARTFIY